MGLPRLILLSTCVLAASCNLFGPTATIDAGVDGDGGEPRDVGADVADGMTDARGATDISADVPPQTDACIPPTDAELCAQFDAVCGELFVREATGVTRRFPALDVGTDSASCGDTEYLDVCGEEAPSLAFTASAEGLYFVKAHLWASQALSGPILSRMSLSRGADTVAEFQITGTESNLETYGALVPLTVGEHLFSWSLTNDHYDPSIPEDRNLYFDWFEVEGPMAPPVDVCGTVRSGIDCGSCPDNTNCAVNEPNLCSCPCPLPGGGCAAPGEQAQGSCAVCDPVNGWGLGGSCADGADCTDDICDSDTAVCSNPAKDCSGGPCETGTCVAGTCEYSNRTDGETCGTGGVCMTGACECADGTSEESKCDDGVDDDCDGDIDCDDTDCEGRRCGPAMNCTAGTCQ